jgi:ABC-type lipoprotein export system ATPase subunit
VGVLDDPTSELDMATAERVWEVLEQAVSEGATLVVTTTDPSEAARCDNLLQLPTPELPRAGGLLCFRLCSSVRQIQPGAHRSPAQR